MKEEQLAWNAWDTENYAEFGSTVLTFFFSRTKQPERLAPVFYKA